MRRQLIYDDLLSGLGESQFQIHSQIFQVLIPNVFIQQYWHIAQYFAQYWAGGCNSQDQGVVSAPRWLSNGYNRMKVVGGRVPGH